jgi:hypothetical protein
LFVEVLIDTDGATVEDDRTWELDVLLLLSEARELDGGYLVEALLEKKNILAFATTPIFAIANLLGGESGSSDTEF